MQEGRTFALWNFEMKNIVLFGPPGAGKGIQSTFLVEKFGFVHLSTGDIFRFNIKNATELGTLAKSYMDQGKLVPDAVTIDMLQAEWSKHPDAVGFLFDGFPRTQAQAEALDAILAEAGQQISAMIGLEVPDEELMARLLERGKTSGRPDDANPEVIAQRVAVYHRETAPVQGYYEAQGKYKGISGVGSISDIAAALEQTLHAL